MACVCGFPCLAAFGLTCRHACGGAESPQGDLLYFAKHILPGHVAARVSDNAEACVPGRILWAHTSERSCWACARDASPVGTPAVELLGVCGAALLWRHTSGRVAGPVLMALATEVVLCPKAVLPDRFPVAVAGRL